MTNAMHEQAIQKALQLLEREGVDRRRGELHAELRLRDAGFYIAAAMDAARRYVAGESAASVEGDSLVDLLAKHVHGYADGEEYGCSCGEKHGREETIRGLTYSTAELMDGTPARDHAAHLAAVLRAHAEPLQAVKPGTALLILSDGKRAVIQLNPVVETMLQAMTEPPALSIDGEGVER